MWKDPGEDPGGGAPPPQQQQQQPTSSRELTDLKDQCEQQEVLIAQLKEMLRKTEQSSVTQEKVDEYMNTLTRMNARAKQGKKQRGDNEGAATRSTKIDTPATEKINLLRQQLEVNKAKIAERGKSQKGIEEMVTQLKAQLEDSQQLINQAPVNLAFQENKEYSINSTSEELYNVLITKEKRITELSFKVQKLESNVLDLQENLKEKDSVIDARTKAITLMSENLSKKSKGTLDALDETKEQMRKMQENFVTLESEMKARQMKLLDDLRLKNYEIAELQELNTILQEEKAKLLTEGDVNSSNSDTVEMLKQQIEAHNTSFTDLQKQLNDLKIENNRLQDNINLKDSTITDLESNINRMKEKSIEGDADELNKLKKQLEESNKNMIKMKATSKSKIKELNKKLESFKKISDANAEIVKLEAENSKLTQKIAELEEEKGSLQLKLAETDNGKDEHEDLQQNVVIEEKDEKISALESEITSLKNEIETLIGKFNTSEMTSITFEEQMDNLEKEKQQLSSEKQQIINEKDELLEKIEMLNKEKQELSVKLDNYIQENMELVDKLEKLSAEKVSSAESIEIVEALTQQEKLELEAYQKNLDIASGNLKLSEENLPQVDLNESVNELTEETSELLQKIELFTVERREVMDKMEQLKRENNELNLKLNEVENNRDILAETYEQLQNEKENLLLRLEEISKENQKDGNSENITQLEERIRILVDENNDLLKKYEEQQHADINLNKDVEDYKKLIDSKAQEILSLAESLNQLNKNLEETRKENENLKNEIITVQTTVANTQSIISELEETKSKLSEKLEQLENSSCETQQLLDSKDNEIQKLIKERDNNYSVISDLHEANREKEQNFERAVNDFKNKYLALQKQLEDNSGSLSEVRKPLESKIDELTNKNKEQLDKMKKIAATLKKKTQAYQELEEKFKGSQEKWENEVKEKDNKLNQYETKISSLVQQLQELEAEVSNLQRDLDAKSTEYNNLLQNFEQFKNDKLQEIQNLEQQSVELQRLLTEKLEKHETLQQELMQQTRDDDVNGVKSGESGLQSKIQELEMIIETRESELADAKNRISNLEEGLSKVEERRMSLEKKAAELGVQLEEKTQNYKEISETEVMLEQRFATLAAHDEIIEEKLQASLQENVELKEQISALNSFNKRLKKKVDDFKDNLEKLKNFERTVDELESKKVDLTKTVNHLDAELKNSQAEYQKLLIESREEFDKMNNDWQMQFDEMFKEKTELMVKCEKLEEELKDILEKEMSFGNELIEYKTKLETSESQIKNYEEQMQMLASNQQQQLDDPSSFFDQLSQNDIMKKLDESESENLHLRSEFERINAELNTAQSNYNASAQEITYLKQEIDSLHKQLLEKSSLTTVGSQMTSEPIAPSDGTAKPVPTIIWSDQSNDFFDFVATPPSTEVQQTPHTLEEQFIKTESTITSSVQRETTQELDNKVKTLEFMLYTAEKERDEALEQCRQLTNELTRIVYHKEIKELSTQNQSSISSDIDSQIVSESDTKITPEISKILQKLEYEEFRPPVSSSEVEIDEGLCRKKSAYLCYPEEKPQSEIESQIISGDITDTPETRKKLQQIEFEPVNAPVTSQGDVKEKAPEPKKAYFCYDTAGAFGENDDGWGWGPEEAKLEAEHIQRADATEIESLRNKIRVLEMERENHLEEINQLQIKSGKLIKKLKEFKNKNEELSKMKKSDDLFNLDDTIQEEFKLQIQQVEKRLKETQTELERERAEKSSIQKRVDVLTSANERMVEMKEKQDVELLSLQRNYRDLSVKLERFEWGDDGFASEDSKVQSSTVKEPESSTGEDIDKLRLKIEQLNEMIKDLTLDNEELQSLLEEQRDLRSNAEKSKISEKQYDEILNESNVLKEQLNSKFEEQKRMENEIYELQKNLQESIRKYEEIERVKDEINIANQSKDLLIEQFQHTVQELEAEKANNIERLITLENEKMQTSLHTAAETESRINTLLQQKDELFTQLQEKNLEIVSMKESGEIEVAALKAQLDEKLQQIDRLTDENRQLTETIAQKTDELQRLETEKLEIISAVELANREWELRVDQRGSDVAESWKLHLDSRETEFTQIQDTLKREINELEERCNALVNENNELRKNVDAEIRNEVDRISALQQQISDRQQTINDITRNLVEKQNEIDQLIGEISKLNSDISELNHMIQLKENDLDSNQKQLKEQRAIVGAIAAKLEVQDPNTILTTCEHLLSIQKDLAVANATCEDYRQQVETITAQKLTLEQELSRLNEVIVGLNNQLIEVNQQRESHETVALHSLQQQIIDYQQAVTNLNHNLAEKDHLYNNLINEYQNSQHVFAEKQTEFHAVKLALDEKEHAFNNIAEEVTQQKIFANEQLHEIQTLKRRLLDNENHYEDQLTSKDADIANLQIQLNDQITKINEYIDKTQRFDHISTQLSEKINECSELQQKIDEQNILLEDENKQLVELRAIIEDQVLKIEDLKQELFEKSNDYDSLIAEVDMSRITDREKRKEESEKRSDEEDLDDLTEPVSRAELDLALYMLHQRDVRCEELTVELTQLLEERDTLQLRLSNALREKEEICRNVNVELPGTSTETASGTGTSFTKINEKTSSDSNLDNKISELKTIGYKRDKTIVDEQELRRFQESILQQHKDVASKLPPEAAARLIDASYTLSRDVQSPSKVVLNWLWGKSTPKVNNI